MGQINTNNYPTVNSLSDADLLIVENATNGTGTTTPKQLRENAIGTGTLQTSAQTVTGAINELKHEIDLGAGVVCYDVDTITSGYLGGQFSGSANLLLLHLTTDGTADATNGYMMLLSYSRPVARFAYGRLVDADGVAYKQDVYADNTIICKISNSGEGTESDPEQVVILGVINAGFMLTPTAVVSDRDIIDGQGNTLSVLAEALTKTASGNPVVISDCAGGKARSLKTTIEAIQDLHGYDKPWAGGAGKNKFDISKVLPRMPRINCENGVITVYAYASNATYPDLLKSYAPNLVVGQTYTLSAVSTSIQKFIYLSDTGKWNFGESRTITQNDLDSIVYWYNDSEGSQPAEITNVQIEEGSAATSYAPYSNICPISGRTEVAVVDEGKNLYNNEVGTSSDSGITYTKNADGTIKATGTASANSYYNMTNVVFPAGTYAFNGCPSGGADNKYKISLFNVTTQQTIGTGDIGSGNTFTANGTDEYRLFIRVNNGYAFPTGGLLFKPMVRLASITDDTYVPYAHSSVTIQLGTTVYGAEVNWDTGVMTVKTIRPDLGDLTWTADATGVANKNRFYADLSPLAVVADSVNLTSISSQYTLLAPGGTYSANADGYTITAASKIYIYDEALSSATAADFKTAMSGVQVEYTLATPTTIQLTPTQLEMLKGYNRVSIDNGSIEVGYIAKLA